MSCLKMLHCEKTSKLNTAMIQRWRKFNVCSQQQLLTLHVGRILGMSKKLQQFTWIIDSKLQDQRIEHISLNH